MVWSLFPEIDAEVFLLEAIFTYSLVLKDKTKTKTENRNQKTKSMKSNKIPKKCNRTVLPSVCLLRQWFSSFLRLRIFNRVPHDPHLNIILLLLYNYNFGTVTINAV